MTPTAPERVLTISGTPLDLIAAWPRARPLLLLHAGGATAGRWSRWTIATTSEGWFTFNGRSHLTPDAIGGRHPVPLTHDPLRDLNRILERTRRPGPAETVLPFAGGWVGYLSYDLGRDVEPAARAHPGALDTRGWPRVQLARCRSGLVYDHERETWYGFGPTDLAAELDETAPPPPATVAVTGFASSLEPEAYLRAVARTKQLIAAGDIFQANITQRITTTFHGSVRGLARRALATSRAWYGAMLELPGHRAIVSMSPELFLELDGATRRLVTRPIKGTRPAEDTPEELLASDKDTAELNMIVDLMRNDLGRVCTFGSVRVPTERIIESHPTVHHGVGEVHGVLRPTATRGDLLAATFPGGSITGAPKIRAMQIIDELEPVERGPYCGSIGFFGDDGSVRLNIAIRTICLSGLTPAGPGLTQGVLDYGVGGGIVADSDPRGEHRESLDKATVLRLVLDASRPAAAGV
ncbi:MAG: anthranilate synthase component I family protein [Phycisphaerales bacterium]|nr:anthranilate synthase component I family protein [Phycisphaerales bacterium]